MTDHWPAIAAEVEAVKAKAFAMLHHPDMLELMERRFREGQEAFGDQWLTRSLEWFTDEAKEEGADLLMYLAMRRVREVYPPGT